MEHDGGPECGIVVPLSLVEALKEGMMDIVDRWHEERDIDDLELRVCLVAMMAAVDALAEQMVEYHGGGAVH